MAKCKALTGSAAKGLTTSVSNKISTPAVWIFYKEIIVSPLYDIHDHCDCKYWRVDVRQTSALITWQDSLPTRRRLPIQYSPSSMYSDFIDRDQHVIINLHVSRRRSQFAIHVA